MISSYLIVGALFYQYTQKVSFPALLTHQEQQMDSIALFTQTEIEHIPELNSDRLNYIKRKILENSHVNNIFITTPSISVGQTLPIKSNMHLYYYKSIPILAKKYRFEDGYFIIYFKADLYVTEIQGIINTAYLTFVLMFVTLMIVALVLKLTLLPFTQLSALMTSIDYNSPVSYSLPVVTSKDERYDLISAFQILSFKQQEYANKLNDLNLSLEDKIHKKTLQLQELNDSLENKIQNEVYQNRQKDKILSEQSRFAALGEMIGNIAHQWRQPLSAISTATGNAKIENMLGITSKESLDDTFNRIDEYIQYLSDTIDDFRNYFKKDKKKKAYYVGEILQTALNISKGSFNDIRIIQDQVNLKIKLIGYPSELMQAFINIFNNAKDILNEKEQAKKYLLIAMSKTSTHVIIKIYDNAGGISKDYLSSIFDPYFTTKHKAQGTGIGLYMSKEMIEKHMNGSLTASNRSFDVDGTEYIGACFTITLPYS
ncbi:HAMP domain-containing histidine kinase [Sulfurimonas sp. MAG313]|nr:HAMP domain-containing sensor histidine kinase [Sulfurimonas sp. MAG313]MDF1880940.1 HAMP domain-containing histidine kinase [Sulfurimonas sp. MAG313]